MRLYFAVEKARDAVEDQRFLIGVVHRRSSGKSCRAFYCYSPPSVILPEGSCGITSLLPVRRVNRGTDASGTPAAATSMITTTSSSSATVTTGASGFLSTGDRLVRRNDWHPASDGGTSASAAVILFRTFFSGE